MVPQINHRNVRTFATQSAEGDDGLQTALIAASGRGDLARVQQLLKDGAEINKGDYDLRSPMHLAAAEGQVNVVQFLLENGGKVNVLDRFGNTPLHDALRKPSLNHQKVVKLLENAGAALAPDLWNIRNTPEFQSAITKSLPILLERGKWNYSEVWVPNGDESKLIPSSWYAGTEDANDVTALRQHINNLDFKPSEGVFGKVWATKQAQWITDLSKENLPHNTKLPSGQGFHSGLAVPIVYNDKVLAVLGFYSKSQRSADDNIVQQFYKFSSGLIKAGIDQAVSGMELRGKPMGTGEQMSAVYNAILDEGVFNSSVIYQELDWWYHGLGLQQYYFDRFAASTIAKHLHSFIAAKKLAQTTGQPEDVKLTMEQKDGSSSFYLCPTDHESMMHVERKVENLIQSKPSDKAFTLTFFRSKGTALPSGTHHLGLYIYDTAEYVEKDVAPTETDIWKVSTGVFLRDKTAQIRERYQEVIRKSVDKLHPVLEVFPTYRDGTIPLMFAFRVGSSTSYLNSLTELLKVNSLICERKFIETFANGLVIYSLYIHPVAANTVQNLLDQVSLLSLVPNSTLTPVFLGSGCSAEAYAYASAVSKCMYYFLAQPSDEYKTLAGVFKDDPINATRLQTLQSTLRRDATPMARIHQTLMNYPQLWEKLFQNFKKDCQSKDKAPYDSDLEHEIIRVVANDTDEAILLSFLTFNKHIEKTNFFRRNKSALSFRLDPAFMKAMEFPEVPFGVFFLMGQDFQGFHVRFRDVARGGIRVIRSANDQTYSRNLETQFAETYNLAYTQNKKNKDIPEFGSKGTILLNMAGQDNAFLSFQKYTAGLLDLLIKSEQKDEEIVDHYNKPEILFLGPDEGTADYMQWAAQYASTRNYPFWLALTTGKPPSMGGVPHDKYGMTTLSVHRYVTGCLEKLGLDETQVTKLQTGGPDGDLGSNEILMSKDKTVAVVDGSGVIYDPAGISREELTVLAHKRKMINEFDVSKLGKGGFRVLVSDRGVTLPNGEVVESGFTFRNEFHLNPLIEADLFVPCGGRPESVNLKNIKKMFKKDGTPRFKIIVEGANLFLTPDARMVLEQAGVVLYRDASANKGGVTSSSLEVLAALAFSPEDHKRHMQVSDDKHPPEFYQRYVQEIQERVKENAALEFECLWRENQKSGVPRSVLTEKVSDKINYFNDIIQGSTLWENESLRYKVMSEALPKTLIDQLGLENILARVPENYMRAIFGAYLASRYVYQAGISAPEFAFFEFMQPYLGGQSVLSPKQK